MVVSAVQKVWYADTLGRPAHGDATRDGVVARAQVVGNLDALSFIHLGACLLAQYSHLRRGHTEHTPSVACVVGACLNFGECHRCTHGAHVSRDDDSRHNQGGGSGWAGAFSESRPMMETMPEGCASAAACMLSPRSCTSLSPSSKLQPGPNAFSTCAAIHPFRLPTSGCVYTERGEQAALPAWLAPLPEGASKGQRRVLAEAQAGSNVRRVQHFLHMPDYLFADVSALSMVYSCKRRMRVQRSAKHPAHTKAQLAALTSPDSARSFSMAARLATYIAGWLTAVESSLSFGPVSNQSMPSHVMSCCS